MQQHPINIKPRVHRQNSTENPIGSPTYYQSNNYSYLKPPFPTDYQNRPPSHYQRSSVQSNIIMPQSKVEHNRSANKLDSFARVILPR